ncbi:MAG: spore germination protein [Clostridia bacterium]|nr:spore germination protein [Clostridia bacterium]
MAGTSRSRPVPLSRAVGRLRRQVATLEDDLRLAVRDPLAGAVRLVQRPLGSQDDLVVRTLGDEAAVLYMATTVDRQLLYHEVLLPLLRAGATRGQLAARTGRLLARVLPDSDSLPSLPDAADRLAAGQVVVLAAWGEIRAAELTRVPERGVASPTTEQAILGSKEAFIENLETNLGLVRRRLMGESLRVQRYRLGRRTRTPAALLYLDDLAPRQLVQSLERGLRRLDLDAVRAGSELVELFFQDSLGLVPLSERTERPDRLAEVLLQGRVALLVQGDPFALVVPTTALETLKDAEDHLTGPLMVAFVRGLRFLGLVLAAVLPALYVALMSVDIGVLPVPLALVVSTSRVNVPYPVTVETLLILVVMDIFTEASMQAPSGIGTTLSIVGTLIIGQVAVQANLASQLIMIVVAASAMGAYLSTKYETGYAVRLIKYPLALSAAGLGLTGLAGALLALLGYAASLESAGVPFLAPLGPLQVHSLRKHDLWLPPRPRIARRSETWQPRESRMGGGRSR